MVKKKYKNQGYSANIKLKELKSCLSSRYSCSNAV